MNPSAKNKEYPPLPNVFFEDDELLTPGQVKKYGYRLIKGVGYRLISLAELKEMIKDGRAVPLGHKPTCAETERAIAKLNPSSCQYQAELALETFLQRNLYVQQVLRNNSISLWWDGDRNFPRFKIAANQKQDNV
jgi:hypothetical protein